MENKIEVNDIVLVSGKYGNDYVTDNLEVLLNWVLNSKRSAEMDIQTKFGSFNCTFHYEVKESTGTYCIDGSEEFNIKIEFVILKNDSDKFGYFDYLMIDSDADSGNTLDDAIKWFKSTFLQNDSFRMLKDMF